MPAVKSSQAATVATLHQYALKLSRTRDDPASFDVSQCCVKSAPLSAACMATTEVSCSMTSTARLPWTSSRCKFCAPAGTSATVSMSTMASCMPAAASLWKRSSHKVTTRLMSGCRMRMARTNGMRAEEPAPNCRSLAPRTCAARAGGASKDETCIALRIAALCSARLCL
eukprot:5076491-Amphidinium_carterae.1